MTDLESRLRELGDTPDRPEAGWPALEEYGINVPRRDLAGVDLPRRDLATGALERARVRRTRRGVLVSVGAALCVVLVAVGVQARLAPGDGERGSAPALGGRLGDDAGWARTRENVLLLGLDSAVEGVGLRPDSIVVASIDTQTGDTLLVSLPRNLQRVPFPSGSSAATMFPNGFVCTNGSGVNTECLLNAVWTWADDHPQAYPGDPHPGQTATVQAVEQVTGLTIHDTVALTMRGFMTMIDAVGGVDVTINRRLPIGGTTDRPTATSWLAPGRQHLDGYRALWFARSQWSASDYDRMQRQRCLLSALVRQVDAPASIDRLPGLVSALRTDLITTIPLADLPRWAALLQKVRAGQLRSLVLDDQVIDTAHPDFPRIRRLVAAATDGAPPPSSPPPTAGGTPASGTPQDPEPLCRG